MSNPPERALRALHLVETLDLLAAADLARDFLDNRGAEVRIDASQVQHIGAQCLQVLLSAAQTWRADKVAMTVCNESPGFLECIQFFGVSPAAFSSLEADTCR